jgi:hypothetical protein
VIKGNDGSSFDCAGSLNDKEDDRDEEKEEDASAKEMFVE